MSQLRNSTWGRVAAIPVSAIVILLLMAGAASAKLYAPYEYNGTFPSGSFTAPDAVAGPAPFNGTGLVFIPGYGQT